MGIDVRAPDGRLWTVRRRVRWPRWRGRRFDPQSFADLPLLGDDASGLLASIVLTIVVGIALTIFVLVFLPLLVFAVEALLVVVAALLLGGRWLVVAWTAGPPAERRTWQVRGFLASRRAVHEVASELRAGAEAAPKEAVT